MSAETKHLTPVWIAYIDGTRLDTDHEGALKSIVVKDVLNGISEASLVFDNSAVKLLDAGTLSLESQIVIHLGYKDDVDEVFDGEITGLSVRAEKYGTEEVVVHCSNSLYKLQHGVQCRSFEMKMASDVVTEIIEIYGLTGTVDAFGATLNFFDDIGKNDLQFVMELAAMYGKEVYAYGTDVYVTGEITVKTDPIIYEWGKTLSSFCATQDITEVISGCTRVGWESQKLADLSGVATLTDITVKVGGGNDWTKASKGGGGLWESIDIARNVLDAADAKNRAIGVLQKNSYKFGRCKGSGEGNYKLSAGMRVTIKYIGTAFSGEYIAEEVVHSFDIYGGYSTSFGLKRNMSP